LFVGVFVDEGVFDGGDVYLVLFGHGRRLMNDDGMLWRVFVLLLIDFMTMEVE
jgi:hypothetical protein